MRKYQRQDKYKAIWMSHSSFSDFEKCHRLYYLHNVYKNPKTGNKINIASPHTSLGIAVHGVLERLVNFKSEDRIKQDLLSSFKEEWEKISGQKGGFEHEEHELGFKERGIRMIENVMKDFKMLSGKTIPLSSYYDGNMLPNYFLDENENIILCGNVDWIEYIESNKSLRVIDFKTGKNEEKIDSLQLPIYKLLLTNLQHKWPVGNGIYWYLESDDIVEKELTEDVLKETKEKILRTGIEIRDKRFNWDEDNGWVPFENAEENFICNNGPTCECRKYEKIILGEAEYLGIDLYGKDLYKL